MQSQERCVFGLALAAGMALAASVQAGPVNITTQHNDPSRTGANLAETALVPSAISDSTFGRLNTIPIKGQAYAQTLYLSSVASQIFGIRNYAFVATMANQVYVLDADLDSPDPIWQTTLGTPVPVPCNGHPSDYANIGGPTIGILSTPVIDTDTNILYALSKNLLSGSCKSGTEIVGFTLWALAVSSGSILNSIAISGASSGITFNPEIQLQRPALLLARDSSGNKFLHIAFGALGDDEGDYHGWVWVYSLPSLTPQAHSPYVSTVKGIRISAIRTTVRIQTSQTRTWRTGSRNGQRITAVLEEFGKQVMDWLATMAARFLKREMDIST